jgi:hypothetical protein
MVRLIYVGLRLCAGSYHAHVRRFQISVEKGAFPAATLAELEKDAASTWPGLKVFRKGGDVGAGGAMFESLREFLGAWVVVSLAHFWPSVYLRSLHLWWLKGNFLAVG